MKEGRIDALVQRQVWSVGPEDTLATIEKEMVARRLTWAPVLDSFEVLVGVVSAWDLLRFHSEDRPKNMPAWQLCTYQPLSVGPDTPVSEAARLMRESQVHHLLVMAADRRLVGVVSSLDLLGALTE